MECGAPELARGIEALDLAGRPVCLHASLRSFGRVDGGADAVVDAFLDAGCTLLVPTFTYAAMVDPPAELRVARNGWDYTPRNGGDLVYDPATAAIEPTMGTIPAAVVRRAGRERSAHPICSFAALGPDAASLLAGQTAEDVFAPFETLAALDGWILLAGVTLTRMTALHHAEALAGRTSFRRWTRAADGTIVACAVGGCSEGFDALAPALASSRRDASVGASRWQAFPAAAALSAAAAAIRAEPRITHCGRECLRCDDAVAGGPLL